ncbi:hypothetical protein OC861_006118 [Tilletia horrida]|nr:hypothetical protein OC861_006118 [Tilletia horrida]
MKFATASLLVLLAAPFALCAPLPASPTGSAHTHVDISHEPYLTIPFAHGHIVVGPGPELHNIGDDSSALWKEAFATKRHPVADSQETPDASVIVDEGGKPMKDSDAPRGSGLDKRGWAWFEWFGELISAFQALGHKRDLEPARRNIFKDFFSDIEEHMVADVKIA